MATFREYEQHLRDALRHLYDPAYQPPELLCALLGCGYPCTAERLQAAILQAIEALKPAPDAPPTAQARRVYELLSCRYVQQLTQEDTARHLGITPRYVRRQQRVAISVLARRLAQGNHGQTSAEDEPVELPGGLPLPLATRDAATAAWRQQVRQELKLLQKSAPGNVANVEGVIASVIELARPLASRYRINLRRGAVGPNLEAAIPSSCLRQAMLGCLTELARHVPAGEIEVSAAKEGDLIRIEISGTPAALAEPTLDYLIRELLAMHGGSVELGRHHDSLLCWLDLHSADRVTVLVIEDNPDVIHLYKRYVQGTRYQIMTAPEGERSLAVIACQAPDIIVLDLMLPDADGWELLSQLHEHPPTRSTPIIVCSVVREAELATALGATLHVSKPVGSQQFVQALEQALATSPMGAPLGGREHFSGGGRPASVS